MTAEKFQGEDRRRFNRLKKELAVKMCIPSSGKDKSNDWYDIVMVIDISAGGISFSYAGPLTEGMPLEFIIRIKGVPDPIRRLGKVTRIEKKEGDTTLNLHKVAASFTDEDSGGLMGTMLQLFIES